jgi:hypothetical protein
MLTRQFWIGWWSIRSVTPSCIDCFQYRPHLCALANGVQRLAIMPEKIPGEALYKQFRVRRDVDGSEILASFDTLDEAIKDAGSRRRDWHYVILNDWTIVWPESRVRQP